MQIQIYILCLTSHPILFYLHSEQKLKWTFTFPFNHITDCYMNIISCYTLYISTYLEKPWSCLDHFFKVIRVKEEEKAPPHVLSGCNRAEGGWKKHSMQKVQIMSVYFKSGCKRIAWKHITFLVLLIAAFCWYEQQGEIMPGIEKKNSASVWIMKRKRMHKQSYLTN